MIMYYIESVIMAEAIIGIGGGLENPVQNSIFVKIIGIFHATL